MIAAESATARGEPGSDSGEVLASLKETVDLATLSSGRRSSSGAAAWTGDAPRAARPLSRVRVPRHRSARSVAPRMQLGRYRLIERLGQGCQGQVWKAIQMEPMVETVALKLLVPKKSIDSGRVAQFYREAVLGARLSSPSLLPTYEYGEIHGIAFMTMPLVNGRSCAEVVEEVSTPGEKPRTRGRWGWWSALPDALYYRAMARVVARIARALQVVHCHQVVHRDIKPANILLDCDREDRAYLCDFGLCLELDAADPAQTRESTGTPLYMAPEKLVGCGADEIRSDIYSLGVTLFEVMTGAHPISMPRDLPSSEWAAYLAVSTPVRPQAANPRLPKPLADIITKAMQRNPAQRYPSAESLALDLEAFTCQTSAGG